MRQQGIKRGLFRLNILIIILVVGISSFLPAGLVLAQVTGAIPVQEPVLQREAARTNTTLERSDLKLRNIQTGIGGKADPTGGVLDVVTELRKKLDTVCLKVITQASNLGTASFIKSLSSTNFGLIGGSEVEAVLHTTQSKALDTAIGCVDKYLGFLKDEKATTVVGSGNLEREQATFDALKVVLSEQKTAADERATAGWKDVLKAFMVKTILSINKTMTTELVNKMLDKYKISDYLSYGDALATQVYSMKYINDNFSGNAEKQLMIRSLLQSEKIPSKVKTVESMAVSQAQKYVGTVCPPGNQDSEMYFINCVAGLGSAQTSKDWIVSNAIDVAHAANGAGKQVAAQEISQSNGYAPPRNCSGSLAQQEQIDAQLEVAVKNKNTAAAILTRLQNTEKAKPGSVAPAEITKANDALKKATAEYDALMVKFNSSGGKIDEATGKVKKDGAIIDICESIASPANFVATSLGDFLKSHLDQSSQLKSDNLPFYLNFLSDVTSNFLTNILTGNKSKAQVLKEAGVGALNGTLIGISTSTSGVLGGGSSTGNTGGTSGGTTGGSGGTTGGGSIYENGKITGFIAKAGTSTPVAKLTPGQEYEIVVNISQVVSAFSTTELSFIVKDQKTDKELSRDTLNSADKTAGSFRIPFTANSFTGAFVIDVLGKIAGADTILSRTIVSYAPAGGVAGAVTTVPSSQPFLPRGPIAVYR